MRIVTIYIHGGHDVIQAWMTGQTAHKVRNRFHRPKDRPSAALSFIYGDIEHLIAWDRIDRISVGEPMAPGPGVTPAVLVGFNGAPES
jgi:hypothetical protein